MRRLLPPAGVHDVVALAVVVLGGVDAADQGQAVHLLGGVRQQLADVDAGHRGGDGLERAAGVGAGLGVPGFQLADAAGQPDDEDALLRLLQLPGGGRVDQAAEAEHAEPRPPSRRRGSRAARAACSGEPQA